LANRLDEGLNHAEADLRHHEIFDKARSMMDLQVDFMEKIAELFLGDMMPIIGFCPAFAAGCTHHHYAYHHPLGVLKKAVEEKGCLGVKMYPPMGFRAWRNCELDANWGNFYIEPRLNNCDHPIGVPLGHAMDQELEALYRYCDGMHLPIMTHTSPSHGSRSGYSLRADPIYWEKAIQELGLPNLTVNLAHLGGWVKPDWLSRLFGSSSCTKYEWGETIARMFTTYSNVYGDLGDFTEIGDKQWQSDFAQEYKTWSDKSTQSQGEFGAFTPGRKILYGSDWFVNAGYNLKDDDQVFLHDDNVRISRNYCARWSDYLHRNGMPAADIMGHNALRYLGLDRRVVRDRVDGFLSNKGIRPPRWRQRLEEVIPV
jgi:predicted TIM-barrel fold metal-dependent hydrolase